MSAERIIDVILAQANGDYARDQRADEVDVQAAAQAISDEFILIPRSDLPAVEAHPSHLLVDSQTFSLRSAPDEHRRVAVNALAIADYFDRQALEAKLRARRNMLADQLATTKSRGVTYAELPGSTQRAIDRIIELENEARDGA